MQINKLMNGTLRQNSSPRLQNLKVGMRTRKSVLFNKNSGPKFKPKNRSIKKTLSSLELARKANYMIRTWEQLLNRKAETFQIAPSSYLVK